MPFLSQFSSLGLLCSSGKPRWLLMAGPNFCLSKLKESVLSSHAPFSSLCSQGPASPVAVIMLSNPSLHIWLLYLPILSHKWLRSTLRAVSFDLPCNILLWFPDSPPKGALFSETAPWWWLWSWVDHPHTFSSLLTPLPSPPLQGSVSPVPHLHPLEKADVGWSLPLCCTS